MKNKKISIFSLLAIFTLSLSFVYGEATLSLQKLRGVAWEVLQIENQTFPTKENDAMVHVYWWFSEDNNIYTGICTKYKSESLMIRASEAIPYKFNKGILSMEEDQLKVVEIKNGVVKMVGKDPSMILILKEQNEFAIKDIKDAEVVDVSVSDDK